MPGLPGLLRLPPESAFAPQPNPAYRRLTAGRPVLVLAPAAASTSTTPPPGPTSTGPWPRPILATSPSTRPWCG
ncbi:MAG: hypothetical protein WKG07_23430 [Hymenobacter sp.]